MSRADSFEFTLDEETEKRLYDLMTGIDTRNTNRFLIKDKRGYHAEYVKVRHGKWITKRTGGEYFDCCSECGYVEWYVPNKYCPNCGANMDAERKEE